VFPERFSSSRAFPSLTEKISER